VHNLNVIHIRALTNNSHNKPTNALILELNFLHVMS